MASQKYISDSLRRKKQQKKKIKIYAIIIGISIVFTVLAYLTTIPLFQIQNIKIDGTVFVDPKEINQKIEILLDKKFIGFIPNKNIFIFSKYELEKSLMSNPAIISVKVRKNLLHTLYVQIQEHEKEMIYCTSSDKTECYYVNDEGFLYIKVKDFIIPEQEIIIFNEKEQKKIGETLIIKDVYSDMLLFIKNLARQDIRIKEVYIKADSTIEFVSTDNTRLITSVFDEYKKDFTHLIALFEKQTITKDLLSSIEYIDLRFGNKVFYKNKTN